MKNSREDELILCFARREIGCAGADEARRLLQQSLNWDYLFKTASNHGLLPLFQKNLTIVTHNNVPGHFLSRLKRQSVENSQSVLHLVGKQLGVYKLFKQQNIPLALFKGALLAQMAYGEISLRAAGDIDILIHRRDFKKATTLLESLGYEMYPKLTKTQLYSHLNSHCEIQFLRDDWFTVVDLHWELAPRSFVFNLSAGDVMARLETTSLAGTPVETFSAEDSVLYQSMHGAKHLWRRLEWIVALAESLRQSPSLNWETLVERTTKAHATRILALGLRLVELLSDVAVPAPVLACMDRDRVMERMAKEIRNKIFETFGPADSTETNLYNLRIMDRKRDALLSALRAIFVPSVPDWQSLALPAPLHPFYYAYRPIRLSKVYTSALLRRLVPGARHA
jgi:hypothetical protein